MPTATRSQTKPATPVTGYAKWMSSDPRLALSLGSAAVLAIARTGKEEQLYAVREARTSGRLTGYTLERFGIGTGETAATYFLDASFGGGVLRCTCGPRLWRQTQCKHELSLSAALAKVS